MFGICVVWFGSLRWKIESERYNLRLNLLVWNWGASNFPCRRRVPPLTQQNGRGILTSMNHSVAPPKAYCSRMLSPICTKFDTHVYLTGIYKKVHWISDVRPTKSPPFWILQTLFCGQCNSHLSQCCNILGHVRPPGPCDTPRPWPSLSCVGQRGPVITACSA